MTEKELLLSYCTNCLCPLNDCPIRFLRVMSLPDREQAIEELSGAKAKDLVLSHIGCDYRKRNEKTKGEGK